MIKHIPNMFKACRNYCMIARDLPTSIRANYRSILMSTKYQFSSIDNQQKNYYLNASSEKNTVNGSKQASLTQQNIPKQYLQIQQQEVKVGEEQIVAFHTKETLSILDKVPGTHKSESGQLYVLKFTCAKCETKSIRSFTKKAYHDGVVLIRCQGCQNIHLIADNLGWFDDQKVNIQTMYKDGVKKVRDPVAISKFLKAAFDTPSSKVN